MQAHEERPEQDRRRAVEPRQAAADLTAGHGYPSAQDAVLRLQHSVGNQVVARSLARDAAEDEPSTVPDILRSPGRPLDQATRTEFEARFGADFADVRVHTGAAAERSAAEIGARAYTSGDHVVIGEQGDDPHTMAHELTHVLQQRQGPAGGQPMGNGLRVSTPDDELERAAEATATAVLRAPAVPAEQETVAARELRRPAAHQAEPSVLYRAPKAQPPPVLSAKPLTKTEEGLCGNFSRARWWEVTNPVKGLIIQKVTRTFNVEQHTGGGTWAPIAGAALDSYVTDPDSTVHATTTEYWEVWQVKASGGFGPGGKKDTFGLASLIPDSTTIVDSTRGSFQIRGVAYFYPTDLAPADLGFSNTTVEAAGGLFARTSDPATDLAGKGVTAAGSAVTYTVDVTWDSAASADMSGGYPKLAWSTVVAT